MKQASTSAMPTRPRQPPRKAKVVTSQVEVNPSAPILVSSVVTASIENVNVSVSPSVPLLVTLPIPSPSSPPPPPP